MEFGSAVSELSAWVKQPDRNDDAVLTTWLRKQSAPEDLIRFWLGHANKSVTDVYSKLKEDVTFRKKVAEQVGIGFELLTEKTEPVPNCTQAAEEFKF